VEIQRVLTARNADLAEDQKMEFRIGVHLGDIRVEGERIFGTGVNVAARLQGLAPPGGICISDMIFQQVRNKLQLGYEDLGEQEVKNIPEPVRVYRVQLAGVQSHVPRRVATRGRRLRTVALTAGAVVLLVSAGIALTWPRPLGLFLDLAGFSGPPVNPPLPDKPSIAVLPFDNLSGDPEQEYFSDGITEDLTTDLSLNPFLFVIARNSAFTYKGRPVNVEDVGRELGVRYVIEGSVRKVEDRVRITAQLIDATTGFHVWSERYDRELAEIFALQSEISETILGAVGVEITEAELERIRRKATDDLTAYDLYQQGLFHWNRLTREDNAQTRRLLERAIELDPGFAEPYALLGATYNSEYSLGWNIDPKLLDRTEELAQRALELDPFLFIGHVTLGWGYLLRDRTVEGVRAAERAVELAPGAYWSYAILAVARAREGSFLAALRALNRALRLNPRWPSMMWAAAGEVNARAGRVEEAMALFERVRAANPDWIPVRAALVDYYERDGRHEEARALVGEILRSNPDLTAETAVRFMQVSPQDSARFKENLRKAGLKE
jgi:adenylate cyclase